MGRTTGLKKAFRSAAALLLGAAGVVCLASLYVRWRYAGRMVGPQQAPRAKVALVFGAGLAAKQAPSPVLAARLDVGIGLYREGKVSKLLLSGDNSERHHDETKSMRRYALERGVPPAALLTDFAGLSTYDTCFRAKRVFGVDDALLVTQAFHLPRALFIANSLGIDAYGVPADAKRRWHSPYPVREFFSRAWAFAMVIARPQPKYAGPQPPER
jgi:vancomycin permeability regulator SanA